MHAPCEILARVTAGETAFYTALVLGIACALIAILTPDNPND